MSDQTALQEAIQRARQLAAKISQNAPVKRTASELDRDDHSIGTVKVTLAYEKPTNSDHLPSSASNYRDSNNYSKESNHSRDRDSGYPTNSSNSHNNINDSIYSQRSNNYSTNNNNNNNNNPSNSSYGSLLGAAANNYSGNSSSDDRIEIIIPHAVIGLVIGKGGENIKRIQNETGATVRVDPNTVDEKGNKVCTITGTKQAVEDAHSQVSSVIENAATNKRPRTQVEGAEQYRMKIPASRTGAIIGKGGDTIKSIKQQSGCDIELDKAPKECGPDESVFIIRGTQDKILKARAMIEARLASRGRESDNPSRHSNSGSKSVATGANAAPVAHFTDLPNSYPAAGQTNSADIAAAWAGYLAQYSNLLNQAGAQPGAAGLPYSGQNFMGSTGAQQVTQPDQPIQQQQQQQQPQQQQVSQTSQQGAQQQQDYTDQWIEFYLMNGRPDYAEQIIEMKKQQQAQKQQQTQPPQ